MIMKFIFLIQKIKIKLLTTLSFLPCKIYSSKPINFTETKKIIRFLKDKSQNNIDYKFIMTTQTVSK